MNKNYLKTMNPEPISAPYSSSKKDFLLFPYWMVDLPVSTVIFYIIALDLEEPTHRRSSIIITMLYYFIHLQFVASDGLTHSDIFFVFSL